MLEDPSDPGRDPGPAREEERPLYLRSGLQRPETPPRAHLRDCLQGRPDPEDINLTACPPADITARAQAAGYMQCCSDAGEAHQDASQQTVETTQMIPLPASQSGLRASPTGDGPAQLVDSHPPLRPATCVPLAEAAGLPTIASKLRWHGEGRRIAFLKTLPARDVDPSAAQPRTNQSSEEVGQKAQSLPALDAEATKYWEGLPQARRDELTTLLFDDLIRAIWQHPESRDLAAACLASVAASSLKDPARIADFYHCHVSLPTHPDQHSCLELQALFSDPYEFLTHLYACHERAMPESGWQICPLCKSELAAGDTPSCMRCQLQATLADPAQLFSPPVCLPWDFHFPLTINPAQVDAFMRTKLDSLWRKILTPSKQQTKSKPQDSTQEETDGKSEDPDDKNNKEAELPTLDDYLRLFAGVQLVLHRESVMRRYPSAATSTDAAVLAYFHDKTQPHFEAALEMPNAGTLREALSEVASVCQLVQHCWEQHTRISTIRTKVRVAHAALKEVRSMRKALAGEQGAPADTASADVIDQQVSSLPAYWLDEAATLAAQAVDQHAQAAEDFLRNTGWPMAKLVAFSKEFCSFFMHDDTVKYTTALLDLEAATFELQYAYLDHFGQDCAQLKGSCAALEVQIAQLEAALERCKAERQAGPLTPARRMQVVAQEQALRKQQKALQQRLVHESASVAFLEDQADKVAKHRAAMDTQRATWQAHRAILLEFQNLSFQSWFLPHGAAFLSQAKGELSVEEQSLIWTCVKVACAVVYTIKSLHLDRKWARLNPDKLSPLAATAIHAHQKRCVQASTWSQAHMKQLQATAQDVFTNMLDPARHALMDTCRLQLQGEFCAPIKQLVRERIQAAAAAEAGACPAKDAAPALAAEGSAADLAPTTPDNTPATTPAKVGEAASSLAASEAGAAGPSKAKVKKDKKKARKKAQAAAGSTGEGEQPASSSLASVSDVADMLDEMDLSTYLDSTDAAHPAAAVTAMSGRPLVKPADTAGSDWAALGPVPQTGLPEAECGATARAAGAEAEPTKTMSTAVLVAPEEGRSALAGAGITCNPEAAMGQAEAGQGKADATSASADGAASGNPEAAVSTAAAGLLPRSGGDAVSTQTAGTPSGRLEAAVGMQLEPVAASARELDAGPDNSETAAAEAQSGPAAAGPSLLAAQQLSADQSAAYTVEQVMQPAEARHIEPERVAQPAEELAPPREAMPVELQPSPVPTAATVPVPASSSPARAPLQLLDPNHMIRLSLPEVAKPAEPDLLLCTAASLPAAHATDSGTAPAEPAPQEPGTSVSSSALSLPSVPGTSTTNEAVASQVGATDGDSASQPDAVLPANPLPLAESAGGDSSNGSPSGSWAGPASGAGTGAAQSPLVHAEASSAPEQHSHAPHLRARATARLQESALPAGKAVQDFTALAAEAASQASVAKAQHAAQAEYSSQPAAEPPVSPAVDACTASAKHTAHGAALGGSGLRELLAGPASAHAPTFAAVDPADETKQHGFALDSPALSEQPAAATSTPTLASPSAQQLSGGFSAPTTPARVKAAQKPMPAEQAAVKGAPASPAKAGPASRRFAHVNPSLHAAQAAAAAALSSLNQVKGALKAPTGELPSPQKRGKPAAHAAPASAAVITPSVVASPGRPQAPAAAGSTTSAWRPTSQAPPAPVKAPTAPTSHPVQPAATTGSDRQALSAQASLFGAATSEGAGQPAPELSRTWSQELAELEAQQAAEHAQRTAPVPTLSSLPSDTPNGGRLVEARHRPMSVHSSGSYSDQPPQREADYPSKARSGQGRRNMQQAHAPEDGSEGYPEDGGRRRSHVSGQHAGGSRGVSAGWKEGMEARGSRSPVIQNAAQRGSSRQWQVRACAGDDVASSTSFVDEHPAHHAGARSQHEYDSVQHSGRLRSHVSRPQDSNAVWPAEGPAPCGSRRRSHHLHGAGEWADDRAEEHTAPHGGGRRRPEYAAVGGDAADERSKERLIHRAPGRPRPEHDPGGAEDWEQGGPSAPRGSGRRWPEHATRPQAAWPEDAAAPGGSRSRARHQHGYQDSDSYSNASWSEEQYNMPPRAGNRRSRDYYPAPASSNGSYAEDHPPQRGGRGGAQLPGRSRAAYYEAPSGGRYREAYSEPLDSNAVWPEERGAARSSSRRLAGWPAEEQPVPRGSRRYGENDGVPWDSSAVLPEAPAAPRGRRHAEYAGDRKNGVAWHEDAHHSRVSRSASAAGQYGSGAAGPQMESARARYSPEHARSCSGSGEHSAPHMTRAGVLDHSFISEPAAKPAAAPLAELDPWLDAADKADQEAEEAHAKRTEVVAVKPPAKSRSTAGSEQPERSPASELQPHVVESVIQLAAQRSRAPQEVQPKMGKSGSPPPPANEADPWLEAAVQAAREAEEAYAKRTEGVVVKPPPRRRPAADGDDAQHSSRPKDGHAPYKSQASSAIELHLPSPADVVGVALTKAEDIASLVLPPLLSQPAGSPACGPTFPEAPGVPLTSAGVMPSRHTPSSLAPASARTATVPPSTVVEAALQPAPGRLASRQPASPTAAASAPTSPALGCSAVEAAAAPPRGDANLVANGPRSSPPASAGSTPTSPPVEAAPVASIPGVSGVAARQAGRKPHVPTQLYQPPPQRAQQAQQLKEATRVSDQRRASSEIQLTASIAPAHTPSTGSTPPRSPAPMPPSPIGSGPASPVGALPVALASVQESAQRAAVSTAQGRGSFGPAPASLAIDAVSPCPRAPSPAFQAGSAPSLPAADSRPSAAISSYIPSAALGVDPRPRPSPLRSAPTPSAAPKAMWVPKCSGQPRMEPQSTNAAQPGAAQTHPSLPTAGLPQQRQQLAPRASMQRQASPESGAQQLGPADWEANTSRVRPPYQPTTTSQPVTAPATAPTAPDTRETPAIPASPAPPPALHPILLAAQRAKASLAAHGTQKASAAQQPPAGPPAADSTAAAALACASQGPSSALPLRAAQQQQKPEFSNGMLPASPAPHDTPARQPPAQRTPYFGSWGGFPQPAAESAAAPVLQGLGLRKQYQPLSSEDTGPVQVAPVPARSAVSQAAGADGSSSAMLPPAAGGRPSLAGFQPSWAGQEGPGPAMPSALWPPASQAQAAASAPPTGSEAEPAGRAPQPTQPTRLPLGSGRADSKPADMQQLLASLMGFPANQFQPAAGSANRGSAHQALQQQQQQQQSQRSVHQQQAVATPSATRRPQPQASQQQVVTPVATAHMRAAYAQQSGGPAPALQGDSCANDKQPVGAGHPQPSASTAELLRQAQQAQQAQPGQGSSSEAWMETFTCPITQELIRDPVIAADGFTYERSSIEKWLQKSDTSPMTNLKLEHRILIPNMMVRAALQNMGLQ